ncbi:hypothetical protein WJX74_007232 [Apatococcus lobatus]|uniref:Uncharacterized protein n=1 Tax=Apatococcus lobatus TaxID=904363 RepID=A0AAW1Q682_9CHLO
MAHPEASSSSSSSGTPASPSLPVKEDWCLMQSRQGRYYFLKMQNCRIENNIPDGLSSSSQAYIIAEKLMEVHGGKLHLICDRKNSDWDMANNLKGLTDELAQLRQESKAERAGQGRKHILQSIQKGMDGVQAQINAAGPADRHAQDVLDLSGLNLQEAARLLKPYVTQPHQVYGFDGAYMDDHHPPFLPVFSTVKVLKEKTRKKIKKNSSKQRQILFRMQSGSRAGKSRFLEELRRRQEHYNHPNTPDYQDYGRGFVIDLSFNGNADPYEAQRDGKLLASQLLGQRIFARHFLSCSLDTLYSILLDRCPRWHDFLSRLTLLPVMKSLRQYLIAQRLEQYDTAAEEVHMILAVDDLQMLESAAAQSGAAAVGLGIVNAIQGWCVGSSLHSGDIWFAMLVGTGLAFCNYTLTAKFDIIDLVLPPLSEPGRRQLLEQYELPGGELPSGAVERALDQDCALQSLCDGTLGIPGAITVLAEAATNHYNNGHMLGMEAITKELTLEQLQQGMGLFFVTPAPAHLRNLHMPQQYSLLLPIGWSENLSQRARNQKASLPPP